MGDKKFKKSNFYKNKKETKIDGNDANKILVSKENPYRIINSLKYFSGYNDNDGISPLCIKLPQMSGYVRNFEGNTTISFKIRDKQLLKKYNQIWKKLEKLLKIEFDSEPVYGDNDKYIKTKIKIYAGSMITNFQSKTMPKEKGSCKCCLSIIMLDCVIKAKKKYYPQTLWKNANINKKR